MFTFSIDVVQETVHGPDTETGTLQLKVEGSHLWHEDSVLALSGYLRSTVMSKNLSCAFRTEKAVSNYALQKLCAEVNQKRSGKVQSDIDVSQDIIHLSSGYHKL